METSENLERELQVSEEKRELVGQIFSRAQELVSRYGELSTWGKNLPKEVVYLDVPDKEDLRGHNRVLVWGDAESEEVVILYNKNYTRHDYLDTQVRLTKDRVVNFNAHIGSWHGDSMILNPPWRPHPEAVRVMGSRFHPAEYLHGDLDFSLSEISRFLEEGKAVQRPKKDRVIEATIEKLKGVEEKRVFGKPEEAAKKARDIWSEEAVRQDSERVKSLPEAELAEVEEKLALAYVDAAFKELSAINSLAQDTPDFEAKQRLLNEAREGIRRERQFHVLAKQIGKTVAGKEAGWSKVKLREFGRMYERHETPEHYQLAKLIYQKVIQLAERDNDPSTQSTATMELARVSEKLGAQPDEVDGLYQKAHELNWQSRGDENYNRQVTVEGYILKRNLKKKDIGATLGSLKTIGWVVLHDPRQAFVLGKKVLGK